jgi:hypothetical protein
LRSRGGKNLQEVILCGKRGTNYQVQHHGIGLCQELCFFSGHSKLQLKLAHSGFPNRFLGESDSWFWLVFSSVEKKKPFVPEQFCSTFNRPTEETFWQKQAKKR